MATIRERQPGVFEVRAFIGRDVKGRPVQVSRTVRGTKREAQKVAAELSLRAPKSALSRVSVAGMLDLWVEHNRASWAPGSLRDYESRVRSIKKDRIARVPIARLSAADVDQWHARLRGVGTGEDSIRSQHGALRAAVSLAVRWGWLPANVVAVARLGRRKTSPRGTLSDDEVRRVLEAVGDLASRGDVEPQAPVSMRLAAVTGARRSELAALRWLDLDGSQLTVDSSIAIIRDGDRNSKPELRDDPTKTANRRTVALDGATVRVLEGLRAQYEPFGPWILSVGERPVNPERVSAWWTRARNAAGVDRRWRLHDLRHWSATTSIAQGHDIRTVANRLGHANPSMTLRTYAHAVESRDAPVAETLARALDDAL